MEQPLITKMAKLYEMLYSNSPVPTVHQWLSLVQEEIISDKYLVELSRQEQVVQSSSVNSVSVSSYQRNLLNVLQGELPQESDAIADDDGSFVEDELRLFVKRCLTLARRCKRAQATGSGEERRMKGAVDVLHQFICSDTLEW
ncbi:hypothetical protein STCU_06745 [Strigomonas culicis]|nr:hypothetical protein STCU_06745 [Strigomonas culicis]|eukprot:EPY25498.1 hypothetical protein STCU_06745 [Strigomonas culicis]